MEIKQHAARLAFNLTYLRDNRPRAIQKGALEHVKRMVLGTTGAAADGPTKAIVRYPAPCVDASLPLHPRRRRD